MSMGTRQVVRVALGNVCKLKIWSSGKCCVPSVELHMFAESSGQLLTTGNTCVQSVGGWFWTSEAYVGVERPVMLSSPSALSPPTIPRAPQTTRETEKLPGRCQEPKQKLVKCGPYHMPVPHVTTLSDAIEEAMRKPPSNWQEWLTKNKLWDKNMDERVSFTCYYKFHKVMFDAIP